MSMFIICLIISSFLFSINGNVEDEKNNKYMNSPSEEEKTHDTFNWNLFQFQLLNTDCKKLVISPIGLKLLMALVYDVASGHTSQQIENVLQFSEQKSVMRDKFIAILDDLREKNDNYILNFGSRTYLHKLVRPLQKCVANYNVTYHTEISDLDDDYIEDSVNDANTWIEVITKRKHIDLVSEDDFQDAIIVMLNAINFKGIWKYPFDVNESKSGVFHVNSDKVFRHTYMIQTGHFLYYNSDILDAKILRLPYKDCKYAMYIVVPNTINGLANLIKLISASNIHDAISKANYTNVNVKVPRFQIEYLAKLVPTLKKMNIKDLFDTSASLPGLARGKGLLKKLMVSNILQHSQIDVTESRTMPDMDSLIKFKTEENCQEFKADRPFLFYVEDEKSKQILLMGKIEEP